MWPFKNHEEQRSITPTSQPQWPWDADHSVTRRSVDNEKALSLVPVFGAVRLLADSVASLEPVLYKKNSKGLPERQPTPSLFTNPSVHGTLYDWLFRAVESMALQGDAIGLTTKRDYYGFPTMIEWLNPERVVTQDAFLSGPGSYIEPMWWWWGRPLMTGGTVQTSEFVHIPWFVVPYRVRGLSPIAAFKMTTVTGLGAEEYAAQWFENGGVPPGVLRNNQKVIAAEDANTIASRLTSRMRTRKPLVIGNDWTYEPIAIKPNEAEFIATMRLTATQIAVIYGVPPEKIGGTTGNNLTYSTVELNTLDYLQFSLRPWLVRLQQALTALFPRPYYVKFDTHDMTRVDAKTQAEIDAASLGYQPPAWRTPDEIRADHEWEPMPKAPMPAAQPVNGQVITKINTGNDSPPAVDESKQRSYFGPSAAMRIRAKAAVDNSSDMRARWR